MLYSSIFKNLKKTYLGLGIFRKIWVFSQKFSFTMNTLNKFEELSEEDLSRMIGRVVVLLKTHNVLQKEVEKRIQYHYLSKVKDFKTYGDRSAIGGKTRLEVLHKIMDTFTITYLSESDEFTIETLEKNNKTEYYIMYFSSFGYPSREGKGYLQVKKNQQASLSLYYRNDVKEDVKSTWIGTYEKVGSHTSLNIKRNGEGDVPVKAHFAFFAGANGRHPILLGTYAGISHSLNPTAGKAVLIKVESEKEMMEQLITPMPYQIDAYLKDKLNESAIRAIDRIEKMPLSINITLFAGEYCFYNHNNEKEKSSGKLEIGLNTDVHLITNRNVYKGNIILQESNMLHVQLREVNFNDEYSNGLYTLKINTKYFQKNQSLNGLVLSINASLTPIALPFIALRKSFVEEKGKEAVEKLVNAYFAAYQETRLSLMSAYDFDKLILNIDN